MRRAGSISFEKIPVDASSKMPDDYMDSIEPFNYADLKPFSTAYPVGIQLVKKCLRPSHKLRAAPVGLPGRRFLSI